MAGIFSILDISRWALQTSTLQLDTVSHNVANANTPGYSRQSVVISTRLAETTAYGYMGTGVQTDTIIQYTDPLLLSQLSEQYSEESYFNELLSQLQRLESLANETGDTSLGDDLTAFFSAWDDVANDPQSTAVRQVLLETASNLISRFNDLADDLTTVERDLNSYIEGAVDEANEIFRRISSLNEQITAAEVGGDTANDLRDERQRQLDRLAELMDIDWFETADGSVTVLVGKGMTVVQGTYPDENDGDPLYFGPLAGSDDNQLVWGYFSDSDNAVTLSLDDVDGGEIGAWLTVRDEVIPDMQTFFNGLANTIIKEVNIIHSQGAGLSLFNDVTGTYETDDPTLSFNDENNSLPFADIVENGTITMWVYEAGTRREITVQVYESDSLSTLAARINDATGGDASENPVAVVVDGALRIYAGEGIEFGFAQDTSNVLAALGINTFFDGSSATNIALNSMVEEDESYIAAGRIVLTGVDAGEHALGDNSNALNIADLKDAETMNGGTDTFNEAVISWASALGAVVASTRDNLTYSETAVAELQDLRDSLSGVNLDEEMINLIRYQRSYQMAAKLISVADTLLSTLLEMA